MRYKRHGPMGSSDKSVMAAAMRRLGRRPRFAYRLMMLRELTPDVPLFALPPGVEVENLPAEAAAVEAAVAALPAEHRFGIAERIADGDVCWVARIGGEVVYQMWVSIGSTYSYTLDRHFPLAATDVVEYGAYTVPAHRGRNIHSAVVSHVLAVLRERGMKRIVSVMEPDNEIALRMPRKLGLKTVGFAAFVEIFGIRVHVLRDRGTLPTVRPRHYWVKV